MKRTNQLLILLGASFAISGIVEALAPRSNAQVFGMLHGFIIGMLTYMWVRAEADERGAIPPGRSALLSGLLPLIGLPIYLFRTRGWREALFSCGKLVVLAIGLGVAYGVAAQITRLAAP